VELVDSSSFSSLLQILELELPDPIEAVCLVNALERDFEVVSDSDLRATECVVWEVNVTFESALLIDSTEHYNVHDVEIPDHFPEVAETRNSWSLCCDEVTLLSSVWVLDSKLVFKG
jgi:hypothetical protein